MKQVNNLVEAISRESVRQVRLMEVCGGHTMAINRFGIRSLLPGNIRLLSGPGCPVCVTGTGFIDTAIRLGENNEIVLALFGDLMRVPGSEESLEAARARGIDVRIVLSPLEALEIARMEKHRQIVFLGIGFETTAPGVAATIIAAGQAGIENFSVLSAHKIMPPAMKALTSGEILIDGFICPGHVSAITGSGIYKDIAGRDGVPCVISGFEATDILESILMLIRQIGQGRPTVEIQYNRAVKPGGNKRALGLMNEVFTPRDDWWRGLGLIPGSGLVPAEKYRSYDASYRFGLTAIPDREPPGCRCGDILAGRLDPASCPLFARACSPANPVGACMVSTEGACQSTFIYGNYSLDRHGKIN